MRGTAGSATGASRSRGGNGREWAGMGGRGSREARGVGSGMSRDRKSTRLNSSHLVISYAVFCLKKKKKKKTLNQLKNRDDKKTNIQTARRNKLDKMSAVAHMQNVYKHTQKDEDDGKYIHNSNQR